MFYYHRHRRVFRIGKPCIKLNIEGSLSTGALLKLERIFLLQPYILEMAAADGPVQLFKAFMQELIIEEIFPWGCDHVHDIQVGAELRTVHILDHTKILIRTTRNHPRHGLYTEFCMFRTRCINYLLNHAYSILPQFRTEIAAIATVPSRTARSTDNIDTAYRSDSISHP